MTMNIATEDKVIAILADAFDKAATTCSHKKLAARSILSQLNAAGYTIRKIKPAK